MNPQHAFGDRLLFVTGYSLFQLGDLPGRWRRLRQVNNSSRQRSGGSLYWIGMVHLFQEEYGRPGTRSVILRRYIGGIYCDARASASAWPPTG